MDNGPKSIFVTRDITQVSSTDLEGVGLIRWKDNKCYRWVENKESATATAVGDAVYHTLTQGLDLLKSIKLALTANLSAQAGVAISVIPATYFGWIQIHGANTSIFALATSGGAIVVGDELLGTDAQTYLKHGTTMGTAPANARHVVALEALATTVTVKTGIDGFIRCL